MSWPEEKILWREPQESTSIVIGIHDTEGKQWGWPGGEIWDKA